MQRITSVHNQRVKDAVRLRDRRARKAQGRFIIDGVREISRALQADVPVREVFLCAELLQSAEAEQCLQWARQRGAELFAVAPAVFAKLSFGERAEGLVAVADYPSATWPALRLPENPLVVVLEQIEKPGNFGGVVRTVDGAGASAVLLADPAADPFNPNAIRASLGAVFSVPVAAATSRDILDWLRARRLRIVAARVDGAVPYYDVDYRGPTAIVFGSEAAGLTELWNAADVQSVSLPMRGRVDSLNVSVTAAVLLYEALRQRLATGFVR
jgi:TrmH family RNA methyltransferase